MDDKTVLVTFGGSKAFLAETIKAATNGGTIPTSMGVADLLKELPFKPSVVGLFNLTNLVKVVFNAANAMGVGAMLPPIAMEDQPPVVFGTSIEGSGAHLVTIVPNALVKEVVRTVVPVVQMMIKMQQQMLEEQFRQEQGEEDF